MGSGSTIGERVWRLLRSRSPKETAAFWAILILSYLVLSSLAGLHGVGYTERFDDASRSIAFDLNPFLWFPDVFLHVYPAANPVPFILWWVALSAVLAEAVLVAVRLVRGGSLTEKRAAAVRKTRVL